MTCNIVVYTKVIFGIYAKTFDTLIYLFDCFEEMKVINEKKILNSNSVFVFIILLSRVVFHVLKTNFQARSGLLVRILIGLIFIFIYNALNTRDILNDN